MFLLHYSFNLGLQASLTPKFLTQYFLNFWCLWIWTKLVGSTHGRLTKLNLCWGPSYLISLEFLIILYLKNTLQAYNISNVSMIPVATICVQNIFKNFIHRFSNINTPDFRTWFCPLQHVAGSIVLKQPACDYLGWRILPNSRLNQSQTIDCKIWRGSIFMQLVVRLVTTLG